MFLQLSTIKKQAANWINSPLTSEKKKTLKKLYLKIWFKIRPNQTLLGCPLCSWTPKAKPKATEIHFGWKMKGKHSQILHPLGIKAAFDAVCGLGAVVTVPLVSGKQGPKERMVNQGTKQAEHLPAASRSSSTPHCISQLHFGRAGPALSSFHPQRTRVEWQISLLYLGITPSTKLGLSPGNSAVPGWAQPL